MANDIRREHKNLVNNVAFRETLNRQKIKQEKERKMIYHFNKINKTKVCVRCMQELKTTFWNLQYKAQNVVKRKIST